MSPHQVWPASSVSIYNDDVVKPADCRIDSPEARSLADMLFQVGRLEKLKNPRINLLGDWKPREVLRAAKERAINGGQALVICIDKANVNLVAVRPDDEQSVYRLANLKARGFVLGTMVFNPDKSPACYPEADEEMELKSMLLNFFARMIQKVRELDAEDVLSLAANENFAPQNAEDALNKYSLWCDQQPAEDIHTHLTYGNRTTESNSCPKN